MAADPRGLRQGFLIERQRDPPYHRLRRTRCLSFHPHRHACKWCQGTGPASGKSFGKKGFHSPGRAAERKEMTQHKPGTLCPWQAAHSWAESEPQAPSPVGSHLPLVLLWCSGQRLPTSVSNLSSAQLCCAFLFFSLGPLYVPQRVPPLVKLSFLPRSPSLLSWSREVAEWRQVGFSLWLLLDLPFLIRQMETGMVPASQTVWAPNQVTHARRVQEGLAERQTSVGLLLLLPFFI